MAIKKVIRIPGGGLKMLYVILLHYLYQFLLKRKA